MEVNSVLLVLSLMVQFVHGLPFLEKNSSLANPFVGFYIFPHGGITLDPENMDYTGQPAFGPGSKEKAVKLYKAMKQAAEILIELKPDVIIFSTPHGFRLNGRNLILSNERVSGNAGGIWSNFTAAFNIDAKLSKKLFVELNGAKDSVELLSLGSGNEPLPLHWAEVIPWHFILEAGAKANFQIPKTVYIGQPPEVNIKKLQNLGRDIVKTALIRKEFANKKIAVVISGDMSHYHSNDPNSPYPYSPVSEDFDKFLVNWAKLDYRKKTQNESAKELIENAGKIEGDAGHCGYTGFLMLHGMLDELINQDWNYKANFYEYQVPTYFGMMITSWTLSS